MYNWDNMKYYIYTDGACQPNPGEGGWAFILFSETHPKSRIIKSGYEQKTTNNRMEITAVLEGLKYFNGLKEESDSALLFSDSKYLVNGITLWMDGWARNGWRKKDKKPVMNDDLWREIHNLMKNMEVDCKHVKGHSGHQENEECDVLAVKEIAEHQK